ncbi:hypothetical protein BpHYR1_041297 [Brachionus plicatilis]|uniref:Uncharacterized protein n=1 Tax=Brachionus plicatilis TaxID=10195 RepID=A0A3M7R5M5_BRAPC|nr:hypothetical protein BpHYR1_041297 [Brachionus plicatilis]
MGCLKVDFFTILIINSNQFWFQNSFNLKRTSDKDIWFFGVVFSSMFVIELMFLYENLRMSRIPFKFLLNFLISSLLSSIREQCTFFIPDVDKGLIETLIYILIDIDFQKALNVRQSISYQYTSLELIFLKNFGWVKDLNFLNP